MVSYCPTPRILLDKVVKPGSVGGLTQNLINLRFWLGFTHVKTIVAFVSDKLG